MKSMRVRITFTQEVLGTASNNPEIYKEHIAKKSGDADKIAEEMSTLPAEGMEEKSMTVFHRDGGTPILYDYMIAGFIKEALGAATEYGQIDLGRKQKITKYTHKRVVDNHIFIFPRKIKLNMPAGSTIGTCIRPLRAETMRGERIALAKSETVPEGTTAEFVIVLFENALEGAVVEALDKGEFKGIGQWRNAGNGKFTYEILETVEGRLTI
jgi:hypothetical protein